MSDVVSWADRSRHVGGGDLNLLEWKLHTPLVRSGVVGRVGLVERLAGSGCPVVSVVAGAGFGKTTLLSQWAASSGVAFAWVSVDAGDNDPRVLLSYVAAALDAVEPVGGRVFSALASAGSSVAGSVVPRLGAAFASMSVPVVLVLDDVDVLGDRQCRWAVSALADHVPAGSRLVLAGRGRPPLRVERLRAEGRLAEVGPGELALSRGEAGELLAGAGVVLGEEEVAALWRRTEGWPAGLYLAALSLREGGSAPGGAGSFGGDDRLVGQYIETEVLAGLPAWQRVFLARTAVLERVCGPLCDAVLERGGSAGVLAELAASNLLLVPLDRRGEWYRYHHLLRDMLRAEMRRAEPGLIAVLQRRAAGWHARNGLAAEALEYAIGAGDVDAAAGLVEQLGVAAYRQGRVATVQRWLGWLENHGGMEGHPLAAVLAALICALTARPAEAEWWAAAADHWHGQDLARPGDRFAGAMAALVRALLCRRGAGQMRADAEASARGFAAAGLLAPEPALLAGVAAVLCGDPDAGEASLQDAASIGEKTGAPETVAAALGQRSLLAVSRGDWAAAQALAEQAGAGLRQAGREEGYAAALAAAAQARAALHRGDLPAVRQHLAAAQRLRPLLTYAIPHLAVQVRLELARAYLGLNDLAGARTLLRETDELLTRRPDLGTLPAQARELRDQLAAERGPSTPGASSLTAAELRLLPLLPTHLSFPQIAAELYLSANTVKAQVASIYRKLGASSRSQAVTRSRQLGLLDT